jgi:2-amino-4-hydroxy-6-hydroxymethyldihydropteridine diphosphokinase
MATRAAVGLGSNVGNRERHLERGRRGLERLGEIVSMSSWYETDPIGGPPQDRYLNAVIVFDTDLAAPAVLEGLLSIERREGRVRAERWGPRTLDLDLLLYGDETIDRPGLTVPHPEMTRRRFVLEPLLEAWPDAALPDGTPLHRFLPGVDDQDVAPYDPLQGATFPAWAPVALFLLVGLGAVVLWWVMGALI